MDELREHNDSVVDISVIIPLFNKELYIEDALQSIFAQDFQNYEVIVVDDGSTDSSGEICEQLSLKETRLRVFHQNNAGVTAARRYGVNKSRGKYIVFVDADDKLLEHALSTLYRTIEETKADEVIATHINQYGKKQEKIRTGWANPEELIKDLLRTNNSFNVLWGCIFCKEIFTEGVLDSPRDITSGEDILMQILILCKNPKVFFIADAVYLYSEGVPNNRNPMELSSVIKYDNILRLALKPHWNTLRSYYFLYQVKKYESYLTIRRFSYFNQYYKNIRYEKKLNLPWKEYVIIHMSPYMAYLCICVYKKLLRVFK